MKSIVTHHKKNLHPTPQKNTNQNNEKSRRDLMCVGRYAAKVMRNEQSEMEHNRSEMPAKSHSKHASQRDAITPP